MKKLLRCHLLLFLMLFFQSRIVAQTITQNNGSAVRETYALVIGIAQYENKNIPALNYPDRDAGLFADYLMSTAGGSVPEHHIKLLVNKDASIAAVYNAMNWLSDSAKEDDLVYVYFSGHGDIETGDTFSLGYLLAYNSPPNNYRNNAITIEDLNNQANTLTLKNKAKVILITDACHSGKLAGDFYKGKQLVANQLRMILNNEVRLTSCSADEEAQEGIFWGGGRGAFSYYLLSGLYGFSDLDRNGFVNFKELKLYLDSAFVADKELQRTQHKQRPVLDGNPGFPLARVDTASWHGQSSIANTGTTISKETPRLKALGRQPIDYFFTLTQTAALDSVAHFKRYLKLPSDALSINILSDYLTFLRSQNEKYSVLTLDEDEAQEHYLNHIANISTDTIELLLQQVKTVRSINKRFNERYVQAVQDKAQSMINAYLSGDVAELERRQYYYSGTRSYDAFLSQMKLALKIIPPDHYLSKTLKIQYSYLSGLCDRMKMATTSNAARLLKSAFAKQYQALHEDQYAAYIHNELGNLFLYKNDYDSAFYCFDNATKLAPTWAIPWSNLIRLNLGLKKMPQAKEAVRIADSLQPDLAYVNVNAGLVMDRDSNWLAAESYYLRAIARNSVHYLPFERLGKLYIHLGEYDQADYYLYQAKIRKDKFKVNDRSFEFGIELGGMPQWGYPIRDSTAVILDDLYRRAAQYEKEKSWVNAFETYSAIAEVENEVQNAQAAFKGLIDVKGIVPGSMEFTSLFSDPEQLTRYERPVPNGGVLKAVRLHETLGEYKEAETLLLKQVSLNRKAGYVRQKMLDNGFEGPGQVGGAIPPFNYYWLNINLAIESETYNFYKRMLERFPRDFEWYRNAGLFLHDRLELSFNRIVIKNQPAFYEFLLHEAYPFLGGEEPHEAYDIRLSLPGTGEEMTIHVPEYDPLGESLIFLQQGAKLSGNKVEPSDVLEALGDVNGWMGNQAEAMKYYDDLLQQEPENDKVRLKLIDRLTFENRYPAALRQLEILSKRRPLNNQQLYQLASYQMLNDETALATSTIKQIQVKNKDQHDSVMAFYARLNFVNGNLKTALQYVKDSLSQMSTNEEVFDEEYNLKMKPSDFRRYSMARIYAYLHQGQKAMATLKSLLDDGFWYSDLLNNDPAWRGMRGKIAWKKLMQNYSFDQQYMRYQITKFQDVNTLNYRIPDGK